MRKDQRSEVKEEGLKFSRGQDTGNLISDKLMSERLRKHPLQKQFPLCSSKNCNSSSDKSCWTPEHFVHLENFHILEHPGIQE